MISPVVGLFALLWNFWQQSEIDEQAERGKSLEEQIQTLRDLHAKHHELLRKMLVVLEQRVGQDIDADGVIGELLKTPVPDAGAGTSPQPSADPGAAADRGRM